MKPEEREFLALAEQSTARALRITQLKEELAAARAVLQKIADEEYERDEWEGAEKFHKVHNLAYDYLKQVK